MWNSKVTSYTDFLLYHRKQLEYLKVPDIFWEEIYQKCSKGIFDAGEAFSFEEVDKDSSDDEPSLKEDEDIQWKVSVISENGISSDDRTQIYLIDHAYTYTLQNIEMDLLENEKLCDRITSIMNIHTSYQKKEEVVSKILEKIWRFCHPYVYGTGDISDDTWTVWYIMDELGSRIRHSPNPTFRTVPFFYVPDRLAYCLLYPVKFVEYGDEVTRNYVEGQYTDELSYKAAILPWEYHSFLDVDCCSAEPPVDFIQSGRVKESLPDAVIEPSIVTTEKKMKVFCEYSVIKMHLKHPAFELSDNEEDADILWLNYHFKEYKELSQHPHKFVNQFPFEHILTSKDLLAVVCRRTVDGDLLNRNTLDTYPSWFPTTYNLKTELAKFISYFQQREKRGLDNYWICKPWNRARGADMHITNNLNFVVRLSNVCPKVACKYITDPVLFPVENVGLVKMDIRYIIILKNAKPVELYAYKNFWLRFANKPFSLDSFDDYEKHFTVMNYNKCNLKQMYCTEFIARFENYYSDYKWSDIEQQIFHMFSEVFKGATAYSPPAGLFNNPQSRAMYGVDLMLQWDRKSDIPKIQPVILEVNWAPDCQRACQYYPEFFNDIFEVMFLSQEQNPNVILL